MPNERQAIITFGGILLDDNLGACLGGEQFLDDYQIEYLLPMRGAAHTFATEKPPRLFTLQFDIYQSAAYGTPHKGQITDLIKAARLNDTAIAIVVDDYESFSCNAKVVEQDGKLYTIGERSGGIIRRMSIVMREA